MCLKLIWMRSISSWSSFSSSVTTQSVASEFTGFRGSCNYKIQLAVALSERIKARRLWKSSVLFPGRNHGQFAVVYDFKKSFHKSRLPAWFIDGRSKFKSPYFSTCAKKAQPAFACLTSAVIGSCHLLNNHKLCTLLLELNNFDAAGPHAAIDGGQLASNGLEKLIDGFNHRNQIEFGHLSNRPWRSCFVENAQTT